MENGVAFFTTATAICRTDGTPEGTRCFQNSPYLYDVPSLLNGKAYVPSGRQTIAEFDGTSAPRDVMGLASGLSYRDFTSNGHHIYYLTNTWYIPSGFHLMRTDGTEAGTSHVHAFGTTDAAILGRAGNHLLLRVLDTSVWKPEYDDGVWAIDGTTGRASLLLPGVWARERTSLGGLFLFATFDHPTALWRTDGTTGGTFVLAHGATADRMSIRDGHAYFTSGRQVWRTDGTTAIPLRKVDFDPEVTGVAGPSGSRLCLVEKQEDSVVVWGGDDTYGPLVELARVPYELLVSTPKTVAHAGPLAFFFIGADDETRLWRSDGTVAGTFAIGAFRFRYDSQLGLTALGDKVLFFADDHMHGTEPWISDGTREGTFMLADLTAGGVLRGTVTDAATGEPLPNAIVDAEMQDRLDADTVRTDAAGRFRFEGAVGHYFVRARTNEHVESARRLVMVGEKDDRTIDFALERGARIAGRVVDSHGKPLPDMSVTVTTNDRTRRRFTTGETGRFLTGPLPAGVGWAVQAETQRGHNYALQTGASLAAGESQKVELAMTPFGKVRVRLIDSFTGGPIRSSRTSAVLVYRADHDSSPDAYVTFPAGTNEGEASLPDGLYNMVSQTNYRNRWYGGALCPTEDPLCLRTRFAQRGTAFRVPGDATTTLDFVLERFRASIRGVLIDADTGARLSGFRIHFHSPGGGPVSDSVVTQDGGFESDPILPDGRTEVRIEAPWQSPYLPATIETVVHFAENPRNEIEVRLTRGGTLRGRVADAGGHGLANVRIKVGTYATSTDSGGAYTLRALPAGTYTLSAKLAGYEEARVEGIGIRHGATTKVDLTMNSTP